MSDDRRRPGRDDIAREVDDELRSHIEMRARDNERAGMDPDKARHAAEEAFGDYRRIARASLYERTALPDSAAGAGLLHRGAALLDTLRQDIVHTLRGARRAPGFWAAALLTLSLGLGATTTTFSLANWALLRPIPGVEDPENLSAVWTGAMSPEGSFHVSMISTPNFNDVATRMTTLTGLAGYQRPGVSVTVGSGPAVGMTAGAVTASYFDVLGVQAAIGRTFTDAEDAPGSAAHVAVLADHTWATLFARDPQVPGRTLRINGTVFTVVGVAPPGFQGTELFEGLDLWIPGATYAELNHYDDPALFEARDRAWFYMLIARRAPGVSWEQVSDEFGSLEEWLLQQYPEDNAAFAERGFHVWGTFGAAPMGVDLMWRTLALLLGVSALVLLIASANVANLLLLRGLGKRTELALRRALGAGWGRILRQQLTEGTMLWLLGGVGGLAVSRLLTGAFDGVRVGYTEVSGVALDTRVVAFAAASALLVGLLFAVIPAVVALRVDGGPAVRGEQATAGGRRMWARGALTSLQLAATLTLLVGALLLVRTLGNLAAVDIGFDPDGIYTFRASTREMGYSSEQTFDYFMEFERQLRLRPGSSGVAIASQLPLQCCGFLQNVLPAGADPEESRVGASVVTLFSPAFFELFDVPVLRGRTFTPDEITRPGAAPRDVVILSRRLAEALFGSIDVTGRTIQYPAHDGDAPTFTVVGVVGDVYYRDLTATPGPFIYQPAPRPYLSQGQSIAVRTDSPRELTEIARAIGTGLDRGLPVGELVSMNEVVAQQRSQWTLLTRLMTVLAVVAALLSAVGLYGVVAFTVRARTRELGIRMALGATGREVFTRVLRSITVTTAVGLLVGLGGAVALVRVLESRLFGVAPFDPGVWTLAALGMTTVSLAAALLPARRATRVDPVVTLRAE